MQTSGFGWLDWLVFIAYLVGIFLLGAFFARRQTSTSEFFLAGRRMPWIAVAISVLASLFSGISYIGQPARVYRYDAVAVLFFIPLLLMTPIIAYVFMPVYHRLHVTTAYEYLEQRFNLNTRLLASLLFLCKRLVWMALVALAPSLVLSTFTGIRVEYCILIIGLIATAYTALGGMAAVIWTDVVQFVILMSGQLLVIAYVVSTIDGGASEVWEIGVANQKAWFNMDFDFTRVTCWTAIIATCAHSLSDVAADQVSVQRLMTTKDLKSSQKALWLNAFVQIPNVITLTAMGVAIWVFYYIHPERITLEPSQWDKVVPYYVVNELPKGISGLVIAAVFAAAMSSFDSGLNSIVTCFSVDWYERWIRPGQDDKSYLRLAKMLTFTIGFIVTMLAILIYRTGFKSIIDESNRYLGFFGGALLGLFMLGLFSQRAKALATIIGGLLSVALVMLLDYHNTSTDGGMTYRFIHPWMYLLISCVMTIVLGYFGSLFGPRLPPEKLRGLTVQELRNYPSDQ